jgi:hypothetical protein
VKGEFVRPITNAGALLFGRAAELFRRKQPLLTQRAQVDEA